MDQAPVDAPAAVLPSMSNIAGPYILGHLLSFTFFGVLCVQVYFYAQAFNRSDSWWLRCLVYTIFCIEVTFQGLEVDFAWSSLGAGWGDPARIMSHTHPASTLPFLTGLVTAMVHGFYVWRIVALGKRYLPPLIVILLSAGQLSMTILVSVHLYQSGKNGTVEVVKTTTKFVTMWLAFAAAADIIIAVSMVVFLARANRKTAYAETNNRVQRIIKYTVETGVITSLGALTDLIVFVSLPDTTWHFILFLSLSKLYANTLVATLNSRMTLVTTHTQVQPSEAARLYRNGLWHDASTTDPGVENRNVQVTKTTVVLSDSEMMGVELSSVKKHSA